MRHRVNGAGADGGFEMSERYADLLKQGFMKPAAKAKAIKRLSDDKWGKALAAAAKKRYASYGPDFFHD